MQVLRFETPKISHYAYLIADAGEAAVVDPRRDIGDYLAAAQRLGTRITHVIETHRQEDFVMGSRNLQEATGARVVNSPHECFGRGNLRLKDGESFCLGRLRVQALHTPGHTPESVCWLLKSEEEGPWGVFTGDTLFFGTTGRSDLPDKERSVENAALLWDSVHAKLSPLPDAVEVMPAHGPGSVCGSGIAERSASTIGHEKAYNPVFRKSREDFAREKGEESRLTPRPPYFRLMEEVNLRGGLPPAPPAAAVAMMEPDKFAERARRGKLIDTREPEAFAGGHIPGAYSIWLGGLPVFGGWIAGRRDELYLCGESPGDLHTAWEHLSRIGLDGIKGALAGGYSSWRSSSEAVEPGAAILPEDLQALDEEERPQILDVREAGEFAAGHIPGAVNLFAGELEEGLDGLALDKEKPVVVTCSVGHRAGLAVSILLRHGYRDVRNLLGGMSRWKALELPMKG